MRDRSYEKHVLDSVPFAATLAAPAERGRVVGTVTAVLLRLILPRLGGNGPPLRYLGLLRSTVPWVR